MNALTRYIAVCMSIYLLALSFVALGGDLYHNEANIKVKDSKDLIVVLDEVERFNKFSIIKVKHTSGTSVPSSMFLVRSFYEMAKLRKADYFINLKEWNDENGNRVYKIGFSSDSKVDPSVYFGNDIDRSKDLRFLSVKDYDQLWDSIAALKFMRNAAEQGNVGAQLSLGTVYTEGRGITRDYVQSYMWLTLAAAGSEDQVKKAPANYRDTLASQMAQWQKEATALRDSITKKMTPGQIEEAQRLAREWKPKQTK
jgi:TPR repeat protein